MVDEKKKKKTNRKRMFLCTHCMICDRTGNSFSLTHSFTRLVMRLSTNFSEYIISCCCFYVVVRSFLTWMPPLNIKSSFFIRKLVPRTRAKLWIEFPLKRNFRSFVNTTIKGWKKSWGCSFFIYNVYLSLNCCFTCIIHITACYDTCTCLSLK